MSFRWEGLEIDLLTKWTCYNNIIAVACCSTIFFSFLLRFSSTVYSGKVQTHPEGSRWMTSSERFLCIPKAASEND